MVTISKVKTKSANLLPVASSAVLLPPHTQHPPPYFPYSSAIIPLIRNMTGNIFGPPKEVTLQCFRIHDILYLERLQVPEGYPVLKCH